MEFIVVAIIIGLIPAAIAKSKGHGFFGWWFFGAALWIVAMLRHSAVLKFIDSADAICDQKMDGVSLLCRAIAMGMVAKDNDILMRLPYSQSLYMVSTGGKTWDQ
jgi:hypothetical protein